MAQSAPIIDVPVAAKSSFPKPSSSSSSMNAAQDSGKQDSFAKVLDNETKASNKTDNKQSDDKEKVASNSSENSKQSAKADEDKAIDSTSSDSSKVTDKTKTDTESDVTDEQAAQAEMAAQQTVDPITQESNAEQQLLALLNSMMLAKPAESEVVQVAQQTEVLPEVKENTDATDSTEIVKADQTEQGKNISEKLHALVNKLLSGNDNGNQQTTDATTIGDRLKALFSGNDKLANNDNIDNKVLAKALAEIAIADKLGVDQKIIPDITDPVSQKADEEAKADDADKLEQFTKLFEKVLEEPVKLAHAIAKEGATEKLSTAEIMDQLSNRLGIDAADKMAGQTNNMGVAKPTVSGAPQTTALPLPAHIKDPEWAAQFSSRMAMLVNNKLQNAELRLHPQELGHINVKINVTNDQASVVFQTAHHSVREAIESALPRLRDMLQESGLSLANVDVSAQNQQRDRRDGAEADTQFRASRAGSEGDSEGDLMSQVSRVRVSNHLVDYYA